MGGAQARRLCPDAVVVGPRFEAYSDASKAVFEVFEQAAPVVEALSIDEAFLDVRGLEHISGTPRQIADAAAPRRARAGRAADHRRRRADQVPREGRERRGQARRPAGRAARPRARVPPPPAGRAALGRRARSRRGSCTRAGITTVGEVAERSTRRSSSTWSGRAAGRKLHALAHNRDPRPVRAAQAAALDRRAARARARAPQSPATLDAVLVGADRPRHRAAAQGAARLPDGRPAAALRRLLARDPVAHDGRGDVADADDPRARRASCSRRRCR